MITKLSVFDFDSTICDSPIPEEGKEQWLKYHGKPFPYKGWWGRIESLDSEVFKIKLFPNIERILKNETSGKNTHVIILTSRILKFKPLIEKILCDNNIIVDDILTKTEKNKGDRVLNYIKNYPDLNEINVYDDRDTEIASYLEIKDKLSNNIKFKIYLANNGKVSLVESKMLDIIWCELKKLF